MNQLSVFLENKPGSLLKMAGVLADCGVNMQAFSLSESEGFGIARIIVDDVLNASSILKEEGYVSNIVQVVGATIPNEPGGLLKVLDILSSDDVNIEYMYAFSGNDINKADMVFKVSDPKKAETVLKQKGVKIIEYV